MASQKIRATALDKKSEKPFVSKRILIFITFVNVAGAQIAALRLAEGLAKRGHEARVVFLYRQVDIESPYHPYEVLVPVERPGLRGYVNMVWSTICLVRRYRPDVVLTFLPLAHAIGQSAAFLTGVRRRIAAHRMPIDTAQKPLRLVDLLYAHLGIYTDVTAVSRSVLDTCKSYPARLRRRINVIYNGLVDWTPSSLSKREARLRFNVPDSSLVLVTVGRFVPQKNYFFMLRVIREIEDAILVVAGDGPLRSKVEQKIIELGISDRVMLIGNLARVEMPHLIAAGDVFIQTSTYEGNSNSMLEALASGAAIIANDIPEQREVLEDPDTGEITGALVPVDDLTSWVSTIKKLGYNEKLRLEAGYSAKARSPAFSYDRMIDAYERIIVAD